MKKIYDKIRSSADAKTLIRSFISLSVLQFFGYFAPLLTFPYLAKVIGVDSFGKLALASSIVVYFETLTDFGFNYTAVRDIAKNRGDIDKISRIFSLVMVTKYFLFFVSLIIFTVMIHSIPLLYENRLLMWLTFLSIPGRILFPDWLFQGMEEMKYITILNALSKLLFVFLVFIVIKEKSDFIYQPLLVLTGNVVSGLISLYYLKVRFGITFVVPKFSEILKLIEQGKDMFISLFLPNLYTNFSVTLLGFYGGAFVTGIYSSGKRFIDLTEQILGVLSRSFFPFLVRRIDKHDLYVRISGVITLSFSVILFFSADKLVTVFYTEEFSESATVIRIMSLSPFFLFLMNTYGINYLVIVGKEKVLRNIIFFCSVGGFILAWYSILNFSYVGVAVTITTVWGVRGLLTWYYANKFKRLI